jgi:hypothetical protein
MARRTSQINSDELSRDSISAGCAHRQVREQVTHLFRKPEHESREEVNELNPSSVMRYFAAGYAAASRLNHKLRKRPVIGSADGIHCGQLE